MCTLWRLICAGSQRDEQMNQFEKHLTENGVTVLKFFLHISKEEQKKRLQACIDDPTKQWKFAMGDLKERCRGMSIWLRTRTPST